jgi:uncharacterized protein YbcV (DUF1398 family)
MKQTQEGEMIFPEVVRRLLALGVESYFVDFAAGKETFYVANGETHTEPMKIKPGSVAAEPSPSGLLAAIRGAQSDTIRYPEFVKRSTDAGVAGYRAFLTGKKVVYFGRKGENHTEEFPQVQPQTRP